MTGRNVKGLLSTFHFQSLSLRTYNLTESYININFAGSVKAGTGDTTYFFFYLL